MNHLRRLACCLTVLCCTIPAVSSWGWGQRGHETVEVVALRLMPHNSFTELMLNNIDEVKFLSMVPDMHWKHGSKVPHPLEGQAHFFAFDYYSPGGGPVTTDINALIAKFGHAEVLKNGTAPWRMHQMAVLLANTLKKPNVSSAEVLQVASTMGHYVGDLGNPLHVSMDYDGVEIGRKGLHSFFETITVNAMDVMSLETAVAKAAQTILPKIPNDVRPIDGGMALAHQGHLEAITLLAAAKKLGLTKQLQVQEHPIIIRTLANSTAMLAKVWEEAYILAGSPVLKTGKLGQVGIPPYVELDYIQGAAQYMGAPFMTPPEGEEGITR